MPLFNRPFEVTQFWSTDRYATHRAKYENLEAYLNAETDRPDQWFFSVSIPGTELAIGNYLHPFLPSRQNISALNSAARDFFKFMETIHRTGRKEMPVQNPLKKVQASPVRVTRNLNHYAYRTALYRALADDWGMLLPLPSQFGEDIIRLEFRPGLPCGPAMIKAVEPLLIGAWGPCRKLKVATKHAGRNVIDTVTYEMEDGGHREQDFDITEFYGMDMPATDFDFSDPSGHNTNKQPVMASERTNREEGSVEFSAAVVSDMHLFFSTLAKLLAESKSYRVVLPALYQAFTGKPAKVTWSIHPPGLREATSSVVEAKWRVKISEDELRILLEMAEESHGIVENDGQITLRTKKPWWKFWT